MQQKYTPKDVANLVAAVESAFTAEFAKSKVSSLAKSEDGEKPHEDKEHEEKPEHEAEGHKPDGHEDEKHEGHEEHKPEGEEHEGHDYDAEDMAHMEKMYRSMSPGEQKAHHGCLSKCMGGDGGMTKAEITSSEPKNSPGAKSPASAAHGEKLNKADGCGGEMSASNPKGSPGAKSAASTEQDKVSKEMAKTETGKIESSEPKNSPGAKSAASKAEGVQMEKSENTEVELLKSENADLKKNYEAVQEFLTALVKKTVPQGKAITSLDVIAKSEAPKEEKTLSKTEIHKVLMAKDPSKLEKSDRDAINSYYLNGQVNINSISHLLK